MHSDKLTSGSEWLPFLVKPAELIDYSCFRPSSVLNFWTAPTGSSESWELHCKRDQGDVPCGIIGGAMLRLEETLWRLWTRAPGCLAGGHWAEQVVEDPAALAKPRRSVSLDRRNCSCFVLEWRSYYYAFIRTFKPEDPSYTKLSRLGLTEKINAQHLQISQIAAPRLYPCWYLISQSILLRISQSSCAKSLTRSA